jgi:very-short-patch-repair endonuclease/predicted transcriptional regulator of viral defense system
MLIPATVGEKNQDASAQVWDLVRRQHGVVTRTQLLDLGIGSRSIEHRIARGRLHPLWRGVYAVGRPEVDQRGRWMGAVLSCGQSALLSHRSAAALWGLAPHLPAGVIEVVVPLGRIPRRAGIQVHRRIDLGPEHRREMAGIPVTDPISTLVDFASCAPEWLVERAINEADRLDLVDPEALRGAMGRLRPRPGMACMRRVLGLDALTDTGLERKFLAIVRAANLPPPETQATVNGYRVDFYWPNLRLVAETDGWRYHRTAGEQANDHRRDQAHTTSGLTTLRFAEDQIRYEPRQVQRTLAAVVARLAPRLPS